jgi:hypothetical protein
MIFEEQRTQPRAVAYRLLGSVHEADDAVHETWLRLERSDVSDVSGADEVALMFRAPSLGAVRAVRTIGTRLPPVVGVCSGCDGRERNGSASWARYLVG